MCKFKSGITFKFSNGAFINNKFNDILVVGNGFDLFLGQKTKYSDFFNFIILYQILYKFKLSISFPIESFLSFLPKEHGAENPKLFDLIAIVDTYLETYVNEGEKRYNQLKKAITSSFFKWLLKLIFSAKGARLHELTFFKRLHILIYRNNNSILFKKIENKIKLCIYNISESYNHREDLYKVLSNYQEKIEKSLKNAEMTCNSWTDVEQFIEYLVLGNKGGQSSFDLVKDLVDNFEFLKDVPNKSTSFYKSLQSFCDEFSLYLKVAQKTNEISSVKNRWNLSLNFKNVSEIISKAYSDSLQVRSKNIINNISFLNLKSIIDFNYTKTTDVLEDLYKSNPKSNNDYHAPFIYHINGEIDSNNLIFGYGRNKNIEVSKECYCFEKFTQRVIQNTQFVDFKNLLADKFNVLIFGHSCSLADRDVIEKLLSSDNLGIAVIYCHDIQSLISISNNLQEILELERVETLLDYSEYNRLNNELNSPLFSEFEETESSITRCLKSFHPVLFFCVESKNDDFLKNRKSNSESPLKN